MTRKEIFIDISKERLYQDEKWGNDFDNKNTADDWVSYIMRYASFGCGTKLTNEDFKKSMLKVAALAVAAIETLDRNNGLPKRHFD